MQILVRNAKQILSIVTASFGGSSTVGEKTSLDCIRPGSGAEELACEWQQISQATEKALVEKSPDEDQIMAVSKVRYLNHSRNWAITH